MVAVIKSLLVRMAATAGKAFLTRKFLMWLLKFLVKQSDNLIDDHLVNLVDALLKLDVESAIRHGKLLLNALAEKLKEKQKEEKKS